MKEILGVIIQIVFISVGLGSAVLLLYLGLKSSRKGQTNTIDLKDIDTKSKFIGRT